MRQSKSIATRVAAAVPRDWAVAAELAAAGLRTDCPVGSEELTPTRLIQDSYSRLGPRLIYQQEVLTIPYRHYDISAGAAPGPAQTVRAAWLTRSLDGFVRQRALRLMLWEPHGWHAPYVLQLCGEYVPQIIDDVLVFATGQLRKLPDLAAAWHQFAADNPAFVSLCFARAASYWAEYRAARIDWRNCPARRALILLTGRRP
ncbi:hypothetical protein [Buchananella hordeovulneris]|uniref:hypothetical protein n=1 Tax=Buchananella hordeovulneris TaxID=52770 RepID=UPI000F5DD308|nr:hypothetical protein [Buchananella hordeovulneris]MDO5080312.1 hypothetical protein [Buchananella hordeovulneris]RRD42697.1 hypothetical protein EII13_08845 [Buchananella hordeovulneris]RRD51587.1 hypothetical protein EII12_08200 [Buchananella hordeovulneris]